MRKDAKAQKSAEQAQDRERMARIVKERAAAKEKVMLETHQAKPSLLTGCQRAGYGNRQNQI